MGVETITLQIRRISDYVIKWGTPEELRAALWEIGVAQVAIECRLAGEPFAPNLLSFHTLPSPPSTPEDAA